MDIRCTTKPGNGWFEIRTENTTDFTPNGGDLAREIGFSYFREIRWLVKYYSIWPDGWVDALFLLCIHTCWKCCTFVIRKHISTKQRLVRSFWGNLYKNQDADRGKYSTWIDILGHGFEKFHGFHVCLGNLRILYTLSFNCFGIAAIGVSLLFELCRHEFRMHYHSKLDQTGYPNHYQHILGAYIEHHHFPKETDFFNVLLGHGLGSVSGLCWISLPLLESQVPRAFTAHTSTSINKRLKMCRMNAPIYLRFFDKQWQATISWVTQQCYQLVIGSDKMWWLSTMGIPVYSPAKYTVTLLCIAYHVLN